MIRISNARLRIPASEIQATLLLEQCRGRKDRPYCFIPKMMRDDYRNQPPYVEFDFWFIKFWEDLEQILELISAHCIKIQIHEFKIFDSNMQCRCQCRWQPLTAIFGAGGLRLVG